MSEATTELEPEEAAPGAFYFSEGDGFVSTVLTRGPWDARFQHGGPPSALVTAALQADAEELALARITLDFLRPVPVAPLRVEVEDISRGRTVWRRRARLLAERPVLEATAVFVRRRTAEGERFGEPWTPPGELEPFAFPFFPWEEGYQQAVDVRLVDPPWGRTPARCWARARVPLVAGRATSPEAHTLILADAESGMGPPLDPQEWTYVNPDLSVYFARPPEAGWLGLDIRSFSGGAGCGLSEARLRDARGVFGRSAQSLVVEARPGAEKLS